LLLMGHHSTLHRPMSDNSACALKAALARFTQLTVLRGPAAPITKRRCRFGGVCAWQSS
jgi:hypothetical protein